MILTLGPVWTWVDTSYGLNACCSCDGVGSVDVFASRRTFQFRVRVRSWQFHISTATGVYVWPTKRHHLPRWGYVRRLT